MIDQKIIYQTLFLDIETVPLYENWEDVPPQAQYLWEKKTHWQRRDEISPEEFYIERAGIMAEFAKIICVSCVFFNGKKFQVISFFGNDENQILKDFSEFLVKLNTLHIHRLCAHNGKEFDFPVLARRYIINNIPLPGVLDLSNKKPWEIPHFDTMEMWKFGDHKNYTSLELLAYVLQIPTPKSDMHGDQVAEIYYKEKDLDRIKKYCENDATTVFRIFCKLKNISYD